MSTTFHIFAIYIGVLDNSGFELTYQDCPRCFDAGVMSVGHRVYHTMIIPPGQSNFNVFGVCDSSCTQVSMHSCFSCSEVSQCMLILVASSSIGVMYITLTNLYMIV